MTPVILGGGLAIGVLLLALSQGSGAQHTVTAKSGRKWVVRQSTVDGVTHYLVSAPALEFGPHQEMPVLSFKQNGDNVASRVLGSRYAGVPPVVFEYAIQDFSIAVVENYFPTSSPDEALKAHVVMALHPEMVNKVYIAQIRRAVDDWAKADWARNSADASRVLTLLDSKLAVLA
jgi:hypothetical protein